MRHGLQVVYLAGLAALFGLIFFHATAHAQNRITGQVHFQVASKDIKTSGVWVDGQYVGNLGELKRRNRLRLLPGQHEIRVRQAGYTDFSQKVTVEPQGMAEVRVSMQKDPRFTYPDPKTSSEVRLDVRPLRAAVFLDDYYVGTVDEYYGIEHAMLVVPGKHRIKIALPGFKTFETEVQLSPRQKFEVRTELMTGTINDADPAIRSEAPNAAASAGQAGPPDVR